MAITRTYGPSMRTLGRASYGAGQQFGRYESRQATANQMNQQRALGLDQKRVGIEQQRADTERELGLRSQALQEELGKVQMEMQRAAMALDYVKFEQLDKRRLELEEEFQRASLELQKQQVAISAFSAQSDAAAKQTQLGQSAWQLERQYPKITYGSGIIGVGSSTGSAGRMPSKGKPPVPRMGNFPSLYGPNYRLT